VRGGLTGRGAALGAVADALGGVGAGISAGVELSAGASTGGVYASAAGAGAFGLTHTTTATHAPTPPAMMVSTNPGIGLRRSEIMMQLRRPWTAWR
jgi:hypothetical protein